MTSSHGREGHTYPAVTLELIGDTGRQLVAFYSYPPITSLRHRRSSYTRPYASSLEYIPFFARDRGLMP